MNFIHSPLDQFQINTFVDLSGVLNIFNLTTFAIYSDIVLAIILIVPLVVLNTSINGNRITVVVESMFDTISSMTSSQIGKTSGGWYLPGIFTLFTYILVANLISMIPYSFALTAHLVWVVALSFVIWLGNSIIGLNMHGVKFWSLFVPAGCPLVLTPLLVVIELLSYSARAISLGLRLSANTLSGHLLMAILGGLVFNLMSISTLSFVLGILPLTGIVAIVVLEFAIAMIQSYVFSILTCSYVKDSVYLH